MTQRNSFARLQMCPRCGDRGIEQFTTHSFCLNCNFQTITPDPALSIPEWAHALVERIKKKKPQKQHVLDDESCFPDLSLSLGLGNLKLNGS